jgi:hypothetical protein
MSPAILPLHATPYVIPVAAILSTTTAKNTVIIDAHPPSPMPATKHTPLKMKDTLEDHEEIFMILVSSISL